ncbi:MarR family winged helix-turn-helix transcriptional regulator [Nocardia sp. NPDC050697]|uniref:MarR family winged helix-turn-helix transcriptional regulator n=1 Tax=Nocardia sp. NPDC050697 TaxID=3155158 RepID=UPI0033CD2B62
MNSFELPLRMLLAFRSAVDEVHAELAAHGHPEIRPMHGFLFQAVLRTGGCTAAELGRVLGISKQAAGKQAEALERLGYLRREDDPADARRRVYRLTARADEVLARSEAVFDRVRRGWARELGDGRIAELERDLRVLAPGELFRLDVPGWFAR